MGVWGNKTGFTLTLSCEIPHAVGHVPIVTSQGHAEPGQVQSMSIADDAVLGAHLKGLDQLIFGLPTDGNATLDGTNTFTWATLAGSTYTLTSDVNLNLLTVNTGITVVTNGYMITAQKIVANGTAIFHNDGGNGGNSTGTTSGAAGAAAGAGSISYTADPGTAGGVGSAIAGAAGANGANAASPSINPAAGGVGGAGGNGVASGAAAGGTAGTKASKTAPKSNYKSYPNIVKLFDNVQVKGIAGGGGGTGGGGGGCTTGGQPGGGGGGGGAGGGVILIVCAVWDGSTGSWTGRISANGGNGGNSGAPVGTGGAGGLGAGGGGGLAILVCRKLLGTMNLQANAGAQGTGNSTNSAAAGAGNTVLLCFSQPFVAPAENAAPDFVIVTDPTNTGEEDAAAADFVSSQQNFFRRTN